MGCLVLSSWLIFIFDIYLIGKALELRPIRAEVDNRLLGLLIGMGVGVPWVLMVWTWFYLPALLGIGPLARHFWAFVFLCIPVTGGLILFALWLGCNAHWLFWRLEEMTKFTAVGSSVGFLAFQWFLCGLSLKSLVVVLTPLVIHLWTSLRIVRTLKLSFKASGINSPEDLKNYIVKDPICRWWLRPKG